MNIMNYEFTLMGDGGSNGRGDDAISKTNIY